MFYVFAGVLPNACSVSSHDGLFALFHGMEPDDYFLPPAKTTMSVALYCSPQVGVREVFVVEGVKNNRRELPAVHISMCRNSFQGKTLNY